MLYMYPNTRWCIGMRFSEYQVIVMDGEKIRAKLCYSQSY